MVHKEFMSKRELAKYEKMEQEVQELNELYQIGDLVNVKNDFDEIDIDRITSKFSIMSGQVVAWLETKRCYLANRVQSLTSP